MTEFTKTFHCQSHAKCRRCRDREGDRHWREQIAAHFETDGVDWPCPEGKPWGYQPVHGWGDVLARAIKVVTFGLVKPCPGCIRRVDWMNLHLPWPWRDRSPDVKQPCGGCGKRRRERELAQEGV